MRTIKVVEKDISELEEKRWQLMFNYDINKDIELTKKKEALLKEKEKKQKSFFYSVLEKLH